MFAAKTKAVVKNLGAQGDLIYNENVNENFGMLTLVKVKKKRLWPVIEYSICDMTLHNLLETAGFTPEYTEEVLMMDFKNLNCGGGAAAARTEAPLTKLEVSAAMDVVDGVTPFTLKKKMVDIEKLRKTCTSKKIDNKNVKRLKLKTKEKLTFVYQKVYNTDPVTFTSKVENDGAISAVIKTVLNLGVSGSQNRETSFTVPKGSTFAYSLMEITTEGGILEIPLRTRKVRHFNQEWWHISRDGKDDDEDSDKLQNVIKEIQEKRHLLRPLEDLQELTRQHLLEILKDGNAVSLLAQVLDQPDQGGPTVDNHPQSQAVSSFLEHLETSSTPNCQKDAMDLLVNAMDTLQPPSPAQLTSCSPDTLRHLKMMVDCLTGNETKLPETLPPTLQDDRELGWAAKLLCSNNEMLTELSNQWDRQDCSVMVVLEVLCLVIQGLSLMQA